MQKQCTIPDCKKPVKARRWCSCHYERFRKYGDPEVTLTPQRGLSASERFWRMVQKTETCWLWVGWRDKDGYGLFTPIHKHVRSHRFAYEEANGPIPDGLQIDHLCRNPPCVRPSHMEVVTAQTNVLRGNTVAAKNAAKTHCKHGHPFDKVNTYLRPDGRQCRACHCEVVARSH